MKKLSQDEYAQTPEASHPFRIIKSYQISMLVVACIVINCAGKYIAETYELPLWLDSFGTILAAYLLGPLCGGIVGLGSNLLYGIGYSVSIVYSITNFGVGVIFGIFARKKYLETVSKTSVVVLIISLFSVALSCIFNFAFYGGITGNLWGDALSAYFYERGLPFALSAVLGELYLDFIDRLVTIGIFFLARSVFRGKRIRWGKVGMAILLFTACGCLLSTNAMAAERPREDYTLYTQTVFDKENGIPSGGVNDIAQTDYGVIWVGTYAGLYRYNGNDLHLMNTFESVKNVNCLYADEEGRIWIGTNDRGLSICINDTISTVFDSRSGLANDSVRSIVQGSDGLYYIGTSDGMSVVSLVGSMNVVRNIDEVKYAHRLCADETGNVAAVTSYGEVYLLREGSVAAQCDSLHNNVKFSCAAFGPDGLLYIGTMGNEIAVYDVSEGSFTPVAALQTGEQHSINSIVSLENGETFVCCSDGMGFFDADGTYHALVIGKFSTAVEKMLMDYQGNLWFASSRVGLLRLSKSAFLNLYETYGLDEKVVNSSTLWQGSLYIGTDNGLDIIDESNGQPLYNGLTEEYLGTRIRCVTTDSRNRLWLCTYGKGLVCIEPSGKTRIYNTENSGIDNRNRSLIELSDGTLLVANQMGVAMIRNNRARQILSAEDGLKNTVILSMVEAKDGSVYIGSDGAGISVIRDGQIIREINRDNGLSSNIILRMVADPVDGGMFVITSNGINYVEENGSARLLSHFPYFNNYDLFFGNEDEVFVLGSAGIYVVNRAELVKNAKNMHYHLLDAKAGLSAALTANSWNCVSEAKDVYLSCEKGVYKMNYESYNSLRCTYRMRVSQIMADGTPIYVQRGRSCVISRDVKQLDIYPEVVNYSIQDPKISYYLEGHDDAPVFLTQKQLGTITYTNLKPGTYRFHLAIVNDSGEVLEECSYGIDKEKRIYDYAWFSIYIYAGAACILVCITWFIVFNSMNRKLTLRNKELQLARQQVQMGNETILAIARTVDAKDSNTSEHSKRVSEYSVKIAKRMGFDEEACEGLRKMALLHDIGKIGIPDSVLNKPGRLTDEEYAVIKSHVTRGAEILKDFTLVENVALGARCHHERFDGTGYPDGLKGENIPLNARIIGAADAFDAMTFHRVYRKRLSADLVLEELVRGKGTQFDPEIVDILLGLIRDGEINMAALYQDEADAQREERS